MLTDRDLQELLSYKSQHPVLSVYLNTDPTGGSADVYKLHLRSLLKDIDLQKDVQAVERYLDHEFNWGAKSIAIFSCAPDNFLRAYPLAVPVRSRVRINNQPHVKPMADVLDAFGGYGVALVDKQGARLFYFHLGALVEQERILGEDIHHTKRGGASAVPGRRGGVAGQTNYTDETTERNMREAVDFATHFFSDKKVRRIVIGGTEDNVSQFRSMLPKSWQSLIVGTFPMSMNATEDEVRQKALQLGAEAEKRREGQLVKTIITGAAKKRNGVIRLEETLGALHDGRVQTLVVRDGYRAPGYRCTGCGYLTAQEQASCPFCGKEFEKIPDAVEMAVRKVMQDGGEVEVLHNGQMSEEFGNIGALLRY